MPKLSPIHRKRNAIIKKRFKELYTEGIKKGYVLQQLSLEFYLSEPVVSRIVKPLNFGRRGGKIKSRREYLNFMKNYNAEQRRKKRAELMASLETQLNNNKKDDN